MADDRDTPRVWSERERIAYWSGQMEMIQTGLNNLRMHPRPRFGYDHMSRSLTQMEIGASHIQAGLKQAEESAEWDEELASRTTT